MKKQLSVIAILCVAALSLAACGGAASGTATPAASTAATSAPTSAVSTPAAAQPTTDGANAIALLPQDAADMADAVPDFLPEDLQELYKAAYYLEWHFAVAAGFDVDNSAEPIMMDGNIQMYPDRAFEGSYAKFRAALDAVFTTETVNQMLNDAMSYADDGNGKLYASEGARGTNIFYTGSTFEAVSETQDKIVLTLIGHYDESMTDESASAAVITEEKQEITLVKTDAGWRFETFKLAL